MTQKYINKKVFSALAAFACLSMLLLPFVASAAETYRFERMWPTLKQPWYFSNPMAIATVDSDYVYVADTNNNRIQQFTAEGFFVRSWGSEGSGIKQLQGPQGIAADGRQFIYVADTGNSRIMKFTLAGSAVRAIGAYGTEQGMFASPAGVALDLQGNVYVADTGNSRIQKFSSAGDYSAAWGTPGTGAGMFTAPAGVAVDLRGYVYVADSGNNRIQKFTTAGAHIITWGKTGTGDGEFRSPKGIGIDEGGNVYVADTSGIQKFTAEGAFLQAWRDTAGAEDPMLYPAGIAVDRRGYLYVTDIYRNSIRKIAPDGTRLKSWVSHGAGEGFFNIPSGIAVDGEGNVYVTDSQNNRVQKFDRDGNFIRALDGAADNSSLFSPHDIALDTEGSIYVADTGNSRIVKFAADGSLAGAWSRGRIFGKDFRSPCGIATDGGRFIYVADTGNNRIKKLTAQGFLIKAWGMRGTAPGAFNSPSSVAVDGTGNVYVADAGNSRIQKFTSGGVLLDAWSISCPGPGGDQCRPNGIAFDKDGFLYVALFDRGVVQKYTADGVPVAAFGEPGSAPGQMSSPADVAPGQDGRVLVSDSTHNRIQVFKGVSQDTNSRAIIVAGGGPYPGNNLWEATESSANFAYRTLTYQGFTKDDIYYLSSNTSLDLDNNGLPDDVDGDATPANLHAALTEWAAGADSLVLYLVDHGGYETFRMSGTETVPAADLSAWLDAAQEQVQGMVTVVYDACDSGSFIAGLKAKGSSRRIAITSTSPGESAYFITHGTVSFSSYFWTHIFDGLSAGEAFSRAQLAVTYTTPYQNPLLDDNGNGLGNDPGDGVAAQALYIGNGTVLREEELTIKKVSPPQTITGTSTARLYAENIASSSGISRVWAVIRPPGYAPGASGNPVQDLPSVDLLPSQSGRYEGAYDGFTSTGTYQISIFAMGNNINTSIPALTTVTVNSTLVRKAMIIAGSSSAAPEWLQKAIENIAGTVYESLQFQGYRDDDIYFTASSTYHHGVDNLATADNIHAAFAAWSQERVQDAVIVLIGEGSAGSFTLSDTETLTALDLAGRLDSLQNNAKGMVTVINDSLQSGSFMSALKPPAGRERIVIASTGIDAPVYFLSEGDISFSKYFWLKVSNGASVRDAYIHAKNAIGVSCQGQIPQIDDNGNGIPNEADDGRLARQHLLGSGVMLAGDDPVIGAVTIQQAAQGSSTAIIRAEKVTTTGTLEKVWAVITPPASPVPAHAAITDTPTIVLVSAGQGSYEAAYDGFTAEGTYRIAVYAKDSKGGIALPQQIAATLAGGLLTVPASSTTTTIPAPVTTTTTILEAQCPMVLLAQGNDRHLQVLRTFRDEVLASNPSGKRYIELFYKHAPEVNGILAANHGLAVIAKTAFNALVPALQAAACRNEGFMLPDQLMPLLDTALSAVSVRAGAALQNDIESLKNELRQGKLVPALKSRKEHK